MSITKKFSTLAIVILICISLRSFACIDAIANIQDSVNIPPSGALLVPDNYPTLRAAVNNATAGDTVFVKKGTYFVDGLEISKPLKLIGEVTDETILNGNANINSNQETIIISSPNVIIKGFTIINSHDAIAIHNTINISGQISGVLISKNNIMNNSFGISSGLNSSVMITGNVISNNERGIYLSSIDSMVSKNVITKNYFGIDVFGAENLTIAENNIADNSYGIFLGYSANTNVCNNNITGSNGYDNIASRYKFGLGIRENCNNTLIYENSVQQNSIGINLQNFLMEGTNPNIRNPQGLGNTVYQNNIANNSVRNANIEHSYPYDVTGIVNGTAIVSWDNGTIGNYWSDYQSKYPNATEVDTSGIGSMVYVIDENNTDYHPLIYQVNITTGEQPSKPSSVIPLLPIVIVGVIILVIVVCLVIILKKKGSV